MATGAAGVDAGRRLQYSCHMTLGDMFGRYVLSSADADTALAELARSRGRPYYDADADGEACDAYYGDVAPEGLGDLVRRTHQRTPTYKPARELYPWVDLQPDGSIRSIYTGHEWDPAELIRADLDIAAARREAMTARLGVPPVTVVAGTGPTAAVDAQVEAQVEAEVEAALPYNCEHVVPQSWFARKEPMRGDLHHLFACESRCNSFRGNTPYAEFTDFPAARSGNPAITAVRGDCGKSEGGGFEPAHGKGPAARALLYFLLRYPGVVQDVEMPRARQETVLAWHEADPVTEWERHRNAAIVERQGNRNPFVDRPELARSLLPTLVATVGP
ncbi:endonuclease [Cellulomonas sp. ATA003]|uniref:endonuclease I family protein n=1 Tax=Cellulomonas sp. ATA003 TaxID=3073064 RepID=UPI002872CDD4|nr:endonuclease [Cellulomonas sp. ATA003]WNB87291.1 endonuclease [Cellulomonas sp. ATA003]